MLSFDAFLSLCQRYRAVFKQAWALRKQLDGLPRLPYEAEFLPAALALQETPLSPAPRVTLWVLISFSLLTLLWACFGFIDIVATGQGKVIPNDRVKTIQAFETATIQQIYVTDGQAVQAGEKLIDLDATVAEADTTSLTNDLHNNRVLIARDQAFLRSLALLQQGQRQGPTLSLAEPVQIALQENEQRHLEAEWSELLTKLDRLDADKTSRKAELQATQAKVKQLQASVPISRRLADDYRKLYGQHYVSNHGYLEREQVRIEQEGELASQSSKLQSLQAQIHEADQQRLEIMASSQRTVFDRLQDSQQKQVNNQQAIIKAKLRSQLLTLIAPVSGVVQQLAVHTVGGVVTPAQALLVIVPQDQALEVEAFLENKDIGFVNPGQSAEIKIETFPYTKYGTLDGEVSSVSSDAINDEKRGLIYSSRIKLTQTSIQLENKRVNLSPGMAVTVEIKTGTRRLIEYFLSPLIQKVGESFHER